MINFLSDRQHQTNANGCISEFQHISASFVQGSGMGPVARVARQHIQKYRTSHPSDSEPGRGPK